MFSIAGSPPISWMSKRRREYVAAPSTTEAEYLAGIEATKEAVWIQSFLQAIGISTNRIILMNLFGDNQGANAPVHNPEYHVRNETYPRYITKMVEQGSYP